jgi:hypothetical protein
MAWGFCDMLMLVKIIFPCIPSCFIVCYNVYSPPPRVFVYISHGDHVVDGCDKRVGGLHGVGTPGAGGVDPMLLCYLEFSVPCFVMTTLCVLCAR